ncbi:MAG TPA: DNA polymerase ligase N-terminal domain-containing protein [Chthoniobacterales bacterium]|jgi:bifunctional non-homologous end joining protein LigD|nr:DNA polymerase ligase N-terminal domain-containing protein [Chthoniobacterales bacterium]
MSLQAYAKKRDFSRTAEPPAIRKRKSRRANRFVVQKHAASRLHYDFRLEMGGTLKSWAVPRGIPFRKSEKHLAVQVEDHPIEYADFEGVIPEGEYGGGTVMVWDFGTYDLLGAKAEKELASGKLHFVLHGQKLTGEWTLVRMHSGEDDQWLLMKSGEDARPVSKKMDNASALSGRTMRQIAGNSR